jgi:hypothetical protein
MGCDATAQVDMTPPTLRILERPKAVTVQRHATFAVNASKANVLANVSPFPHATVAHSRAQPSTTALVPACARCSALPRRQQLSARGR